MSIRRTLWHYGDAMTTRLSTLDPQLRDLLLEHAREDLRRSQTITDLETAAVFLRASICGTRSCDSEFTSEIDELLSESGERTHQSIDSGNGSTCSSNPSAEFCLEADPMLPEDERLDPRPSTLSSSGDVTSGESLQMKEGVCAPTLQFLRGICSVDSFASALSRNRSLRPLWDGFTATNGIREWAEVSATDIEQFCEFSIPLVEAMKAHLPLCCRLTGGAEDFLRDVLGIRCMLFGTPWSSGLPEFASDIPECLYFDGIFDSKYALSGPTRTFFLRSDVAPFDFSAEIDKCLADSSFRMCVLHNRKANRGWNGQLERWAVSGRAVQFGAQTRLKVRCFDQTDTGQEKWLWLDGIWEWWLVDGGVGEVGSGIDAKAFGLATKGFIKSSGPDSWCGPLPGLSGPYSPFPSRQEMLDQVNEFWAAWDAKADRRAKLLKSRCIPWDQVAESLLRSNRLLRDCPDVRLRRIARLARLPLDTPLTIADTWIYVMVGPFLPYVGQVGFVPGPRAPLERYGEHLSRAKSLRNLFLGTRHRRLRCQLGFGKTPSLSRVLASIGGAKASMLLMQKVDPPREAFNVESHFDSVLAPTLNQIDPARGWGIGELRWRWSLRDQTSSEAKTLSQRTNDVLWKIRSNQGSVLEVEHLIELLTTSLGKVPGRLFDSFFRAVQGFVKKAWGTELLRRIVVRVPTYHRGTINSIKSSLRSHIAQRALPDCLKAWLNRALSVMPLQATKLKDAMRGGASLRTVRMTADELTKGIDCGAFSALPLHVGDLQRAWVFTEPQSVQQDVVQAVTMQLKQRGGRLCRCSSLMTCHPVLQNDIGHVLLRSKPQWECLLGERGAATMNGNSRQCLVPSLSVLEERLNIFEASLKRMTIPDRPPKISISQPSAAPPSLSSSPPSPLPEAQMEAKVTPSTDAKHALLQQEDITPIIDWVRDICARDISTCALETPALEETHVDNLSSRIWDLRFRTGVWDKQLHRMSGACRVLEEERVLEAYLGGDRFVLWGVADSKPSAQAAVVFDTLRSAHAHGIVQSAIRHNTLRKGFNDLTWAGEHINSVYSNPEPEPCDGIQDEDPGPRQFRPKPLFGAPSIFSILKWKTVERGSEAVVKWRDIVSFKFHILRSYARLISRSLQLVVSEVYRLLLTLGTPCMLGVRDVLGAVGRTMPVWSTVCPAEADMADMFWHTLSECLFFFD